MTVLDVIKASLRLLQVIAMGEPLENGVATDARGALNRMLGKLNNDPYLVLRKRQSFSVTTGVQSYVVGSGETWDGDKPLRIDTAVIKDSSGVTFPLVQITEDEYLKIADVTETGQPEYFYYEPGNSNGTLFFGRTPDTNYTLTMAGSTAFVVYSAGDTNIDVPSGYEDLFVYGLAKQLLPEYPNPPTGQMIIGGFESARLEISSTNCKPPVPMGSNPVLTGGGRFDIVYGGYSEV